MGKGVKHLCIFCKFYPHKTTIMWNVLQQIFKASVMEEWNPRPCFHDIRSLLFVLLFYSKNVRSPKHISGAPKCPDIVFRFSSVNANRKIAFVVCCLHGLKVGNILMKQVFFRNSFRQFKGLLLAESNLQIIDSASNKFNP